MSKSEQPGNTVSEEEVSSAFEELRKAHDGGDVGSQLRVINRHKNIPAFAGLIHFYSYQRNYGERGRKKEDYNAKPGAVERLTEFNALIAQFLKNTQYDIGRPLEVKEQYDFPNRGARPVVRRDNESEESYHKRLASLYAHQIETIATYEEAIKLARYRAIHPAARALLESGDPDSERAVKEFITGLFVLIDEYQKKNPSLASDSNVQKMIDGLESLV